MWHIHKEANDLWPTLSTVSVVIFINTNRNFSESSSLEFICGQQNTIGITLHGTVGRAEGLVHQLLF